MTYGWQRHLFAIDRERENSQSIRVVRKKKRTRPKIEKERD